MLANVQKRPKGSPLVFSALCDSPPPPKFFRWFSKFFVGKNRFPNLMRHILFPGPAGLINILSEPAEKVDEFISTVPFFFKQTIWSKGTLNTSNTLLFCNLDLFPAYSINKVVWRTIGPRFAILFFAIRVWLKTSRCLTGVLFNFLMCHFGNNS